MMDDTDLIPQYDSELDALHQVDAAENLFQIADPEAETLQPQPGDIHDQDLSPWLEDNEQNELAEYILERVEYDIASRKPSYQKIKEGMIALGLNQDTEVPEFEGALTVRYPLLRQALVQFNTRTMEELFPPEGPVKVKVLGKRTKEKEQQAQRVQNHMNHQITEEDQSWYAEDDRMTMHLGMFGHTFKRVYRPKNRNVSRFLPVQKVIVPYNATSLESAPRLTEEMQVTQSSMRRYMDEGFFQDIDLQTPATDLPDETQEGINTIEDSEPEEHPDDVDYKVYRTYVEYEILDQPPAPYEVYIDVTSRKVLAIYRAWDENDPTQERQLDLVDYILIPGFGYYGLGYLHLIGDLDEAATDMLQTMANGAKFASMSGGLVTKDINKGRGVAIELQHGVYQPVDCTAEELNKAFFTPPFKDPSQALFQTLQMVVEAGKEFAGITEAMTGSAASTGPVGTIVALIEQGSKVYSGIHKRMHQAKRREYRLLARLNQTYLPEGGYPYEVENETRNIAASDYDDRVDVIPVSDPNITSAQQRIALAEALLALAERFPQIYDAREANYRMLSALRIPEIDRVLLDPTNIDPLDPVTENTGFLIGRPAATSPQHDDEAHIAVHTNFLNSNIFQTIAKLNPQGAEMITANVLIHITEHYAQLYRKQIEQQIGMPLPPVQLNAGPSEELSIQLPPEVEQEIARRATQATPNNQVLQLPPPPPTPEEIEANTKAQQAQQDLQQEQQEHEQSLQHKQQEHEQSLQHKQQEHALEMGEAEQKADIRLQQEKAQVQQQIRDGMQKNER